MGLMPLRHSYSGHKKLTSMSVPLPVAASLCLACLLVGCMLHQPVLESHGQASVCHTGISSEKLDSILRLIVHPYKETLLTIMCYRQPRALRRLSSRRLDSVARSMLAGRGACMNCVIQPATMACHLQVQL